MENFEDLYEALDCKVGDYVKGKVISVTGKKAVVDIQKFTEAEIYLEYFTLDKSVTSLAEVLAVGDEIEAQITKVDQENGIILLSKLPLLRQALHHHSNNSHSSQD